MTNQFYAMITCLQCQSIKLVSFLYTYITFWNVSDRGKRVSMCEMGRSILSALPLLYSLDNYYSDRSNSRLNSAARLTPALARLPLWSFIKLAQLYGREWLAHFIRWKIFFQIDFYNTYKLRVVRSVSKHSKVSNIHDVLT